MNVAAGAVQRDQSQLWKAGHTIGFLVLLGLIAGAGLVIRSPLQAWVAIMILSTVLVVVAGHGITGLWRGVLLDSRRKLSLSRFQLVIWSILVLAAFLTAALAKATSDRLKGCRSPVRPRDTRSTSRTISALKTFAEGTSSSVWWGRFPVAAASLPARRAAGGRPQGRP
jgi:hypothetical protein